MEILIVKVHHGGLLIFHCFHDFVVCVVRVRVVRASIVGTLEAVFPGKHAFSPGPRYFWGSFFIFLIGGRNGFLFFRACFFDD